MSHLQFRKIAQKNVSKDQKSEQISSQNTTAGISELAQLVLEATKKIEQREQACQEKERYLFDVLAQFQNARADIVKSVQHSEQRHLEDKKTIESMQKEIQKWKEELSSCKKENAFLRNSLQQAYRKIQEIEKTKKASPQNEILDESPYGPQQENNPFGTPSFSSNGNSNMSNNNKSLESFTPLGYMPFDQNEIYTRFSSYSSGYKGKKIEKAPTKEDFYDNIPEEPKDNIEKLYTFTENASEEYPSLSQEKMENKNLEIEQGMDNDEQNGEMKELLKAIDKLSKISKEVQII